MGEACSTYERSKELELNVEETKSPVEQSLFEKIGGEAAVDAAVLKFYAKVLADDRIKEFFAKTEMDK